MLMSSPLVTDALAGVTVLFEVDRWSPHLGCQGRNAATCETPFFRSRIMGKGLLAVISTRRPTRAAFPRVRNQWGGSVLGLSGLLGPPELSAISPYALEDDGYLTRYCDTSLLGADTLRQSCSPRLERRPALHLG